MINLLVVFGGESCEHEISVITGVQLMNNCNKYIYNIIPVYINKSGKWVTGSNLLDIDNYPNYLRDLKECTLVPNSDYLYIKKFNKFKKLCKVDCAIICLHGMRGEDGVVAGILEMSKIPYASSSICCSSICLDKVVFKSLMKGLEISVIDGFGFDKRSFENNQNDIINKIEDLAFPVIIKPSRQGSSVGISICKDISDLIPQLNKAFLYDEKLLIEKFVQIKKEVNIALFRYKDNIIYSTTEEPIKFGDYLSFDEKYRKSGGDFEKIKRIVPANITQEQLGEIKSIASKVYDNLDAVGVVRFDFIIDENEMIYLNEVNTIPGSMANYLFKENFDYEAIINMLVKNAVFIKRDSQIKTIDSGVLEEGILGIKK